MNYVTDFEAREFEHFEYTPYGETWVEEGNGKDVIGYRFTSKELDTETGLYYFGARYYDPLTSRWVSPDPAGESLIDKWVEDGNGLSPANDVLNWYSYANENPLMYTDPTGHMSWATKNLLAQTYANSNMESSELSKRVFLINAIEGMQIGGNPFAIFNSFHDIAQINVAKALRGKNPMLEVRVTGTVLDVAAGREAYEVKPLGGESAERQLTMAGEAGYKRGTSLKKPLTGIGILKNLYMRIDFPKPGEARYSFYKYDEQGNEVPVRTRTAAYEVAKPYVAGAALTAAGVGIVLLAPELIPAAAPLIPVLATK